MVVEGKDVGLGGWIVGTRFLRGFLFSADDMEFVTFVLKRFYLMGSSRLLNRAAGSPDRRHSLRLRLVRG